MIGSLKTKRAQLFEFLKANGWKRQKSRDGQMLRYQKAVPNSSNVVSIYLSTAPVNESGAERELLEALDIVKGYYGRDFDEIESTLMAFSSDQSVTMRDIFSYTVADAYVRSNSIDIVTAMNAIEFLHGAVKDICIDLADSSKLYNPAAADQLRQISGSCRMGHTFRGSFGLSLEIPFEPEAQGVLDLFESRAPLVRAVSERLANGFLSVSEAIMGGDPFVISETATGLSKATCLRLARHLEKNVGRSIKLAIRYDRRIAPVRGPSETAILIPSSEEAISLLFHAADLFDEEPPVPESVIGRVVSLHSEVPPDDARIGHYQIKVRSAFADKSRVLALELPASQYREALRAHESGIEVSFTANISRRGRHWTARNITDFTTLNG